MIPKMKAMAALMCVCCFPAVCAGKTSVKSPDGNISVTFNLDRSGKPEYSVSYKNRPVVRPSRMGFNLADAQTLVNLGLKSKRAEAIMRFVKSAREKMGQGRHVVLGGDFNEPSFRDWTAEMSSEFGHNGFTVQWPVTTMLERNGFRDMWRTVYPDPERNPGITYPSDVPPLPADKICWAPKADDRDRIDFLFGSAGVEPVDAFVVGPRTSMCRSVRVKETDSDSIADVSDKWFSDHKGVMVKFVVSGTPRHGYSLR